MAIKSIMIKRVQGEPLKIENPVQIKSDHLGWYIFDQNDVEIFIPHGNILGVETQR